MQAPDWEDYELIDCGAFKKLERFGAYILIRPEPQALWDPKLSFKEWRTKAHAEYEATSSTTGEWKKFKPIPFQWFIQWKSKDFNLKFQLKFTSFKHLGIFPEQAANWTYLFNYLKNCGIREPKVLNLFAYTGGASLAAKAAGADVIHLDSVKQVVSWAKENMEVSGLKDIRWVVEDAALFAAREFKRAHLYNAIIMDPPSYGLGPKGERWKLEEHLNQMLKNVLPLLDPDNHCFIINTYSLNLSPLILNNLVRSILPNAKGIEHGDLYIMSSQKQEMPLGAYLRFQKH